MPISRMKRGGHRRCQSLSFSVEVSVPGTAQHSQTCLRGPARTGAGQQPCATAGETTAGETTAGESGLVGAGHEAGWGSGRLSGGCLVVDG